MSVLKRNLKLAQFLHENNVPFFPTILMKINRVLFSCDISYQAKIHDSVRFGHNGLGVVIHPKSSIGENTLIMQNVTLGGNVGRKRVYGENEFTYPIIGNNVFIGPGAKILGPVIVGENAQIGAGAIVTKDVPSNTVVAGVPAKVIKTLANHEVMDTTKV